MQEVTFEQIWFVIVYVAGIMVGRYIWPKKLKSKQEGTMGEEARMSLARQKAATAWQGMKTKDKVMDVDLAEEFAVVLRKEMFKPNLGCATTGEMLDELRSRAETDGTIDYKTIDQD